MKVIVERSKCAGHGRCAAVAPSIYTLDEMGYSSIDEKDVPPGLEADAQRGARACPERIITLETP
ncbi:MAG: ferredoxin [Methylocystis sp.]